MTRTLTRAGSASAPIRNALSGRALVLLAATVATCCGCGPQGERPAQPKLKEVPMNAKPWQALVEAMTGKEGQEALKAYYDDLEKRYAGTIDASVKGPDADEQHRRLERLMREYNPMQTSLQRLKAIAGKPTSEPEYALFYTFDNGTTVVRWEFYGSQVWDVRKVGPYSGPDRLEKLGVAAGRKPLVKKTADPSR